MTQVRRPTCMSILRTVSPGQLIFPLALAMLATLPYQSLGQTNTIILEPKQNAVIAADSLFPGADGMDSLLTFHISATLGRGKWFLGLAKPTAPDTLLHYKFRVCGAAKDSLYLCVDSQRRVDIRGVLKVVTNNVTGLAGDWLFEIGAYGDCTELTSTLSAQTGLLQRGQPLDHISDSVRITLDVTPPRIGSLMVSPFCRKGKTPLDGDSVAVWYVPRLPDSIVWSASDPKPGAGAIDSCWLELVENGTRIKAETGAGKYHVLGDSLGSLGGGEHELVVAARDTALRVYACSNARHDGLVSEMPFLLVVGDTVAPELDLSVPPVTNSPWDVILSASDEGCGLKEVKLYWAFRDTSDWQLLVSKSWDAPLPVQFHSTIQFPADSGKGTYYFKVVGMDGGSVSSVLIDSTVYTPQPIVSYFSVGDTTLVGNGEHPASPHFLNEFVAVDTVCLGGPALDSNTVLQLGASPSFSPHLEIQWRDRMAQCQIDTLYPDDFQRLGIAGDGSYTLFARVIRKSLGDTSEPASYQFQIDTFPPQGKINIIDGDLTNSCDPAPLWSNDHRIRVEWLQHTDDFLRDYTPDTTLDLPATLAEGEYSLGQFYAPWADDSSGNVLKLHALFYFDRSTPDTSLVDVSLVYGACGRTGAPAGTVAVRLTFKRDWKQDDWSTRGIRFVKFLQGHFSNVPCDSFRNSANRHTVNLEDIRKGSTVCWPFEGGAPNEVTVAFLDSSGSVSNPFYARLPGLGLTIRYLFDPTGFLCQDTTAWSNDSDSIGICVDSVNSTWHRFDRIVVRYSWSDWTYDRQRPTGYCFLVPLPSGLPECPDSAMVTVVAFDDSSNGSARDSASIKFDLSPPNGRPEIDLIDTLACGAIQGWASTPTLKVVPDWTGYQDDCGILPMAIRLMGDVTDSSWVCTSRLRSIQLARTDSSGVREVRFRLADWAGNEGTEDVRARIVYDVDPVESTVLDAKIVDGDSSCASLAVVRGTLARVCFQLKPSFTLGDWRVRGVRQYVVKEGKLSQPLTCEEFMQSNPRPVPGEFFSGSWISDPLSLEGSYSPGDTVYASIFFQDSSGVLSNAVLAKALYVPVPWVKIAIYDALDREDSLFVGSDSVRVLARWGGVVPEHSVHVVVVHDGVGGCSSDTLLSVLRQGPGEIEKDTTICVARDSTYWDTVHAYLRDYNTGETVDDATSFVVDLVPPRILKCCAVPEQGTEKCVQEVTISQFSVLVEASDAVPGSLKVVSVVGQHVKTGAQIDTAFVIPGGSKTWVPVGLPLDLSGWWNLTVTVQDMAEHWSQSTCTVDYNPGGREAFCYPNPFKPADGEPLCLRIRTERAGKAHIQIWDLFGNLVREWYSGDLSVGVNDGCDGADGLVWDGLNGAGHPVGSGAYICRVVAPDGREYQIKVGVVQ